MANIECFFTRNKMFYHVEIFFFTEGINYKKNQSRCYKTNGNRWTWKRNLSKFILWQRFFLLTILKFIISSTHNFFASSFVFLQCYYFAHCQFKVSTMVQLDLLFQFCTLKVNHLHQCLVLLLSIFHLLLANIGPGLCVTPFSFITMSRLKFL